MPDAGPEAAAAAPTAVCLTDLSHAGDFRVSFTLTTAASGLTLALVSQRTGCDPTSPYWDVTLSPVGGIAIATDDGDVGHQVSVEAGDSINDGEPHKIVITRMAGLLWYTDDGNVRSSMTPDPFALGALPPLMAGADACPNVTALEGHGTLTDLCLSIP